MGGTRAFLTIKQGDVTTYVNDKEMATMVLDRLMACQSFTPTSTHENDLAASDPGLVKRSHVVSTALEAHQLLNQLSGRRHHCLGTSVLSCKHTLPKHIARAMNSLRRMCNDAKHKWPEVSSESLSTASMESIEADRSEGDVPSHFFIGDSGVDAAVQTVDPLAVPGMRTDVAIQTCYCSDSSVKPFVIDWQSVWNTFELLKGMAVPTGSAPTVLKCKSKSKHKSRWADTHDSSSDPGDTAVCVGVVDRSIGDVGESAVISRATMWHSKRSLATNSCCCGQSCSQCC